MFMESPNLLEQSQHEPFDNRLVRSAGEVAAARRVDVFRTVDNRRSERAVVRRRRSLPIFIHLDDEARRVELGCVLLVRVGEVRDPILSFVGSGLACPRFRQLYGTARSARLDASCREQLHGTWATACGVMLGTRAHLKCRVRLSNSRRLRVDWGRLIEFPLLERRQRRAIHASRDLHRDEGFVHQRSHAVNLEARVAHIVQRCSGVALCLPQLNSRGGKNSLVHDRVRNATNQKVKVVPDLDERLALFVIPLRRCAGRGHCMDWVDDGRAKFQQIDVVSTILRLRICVVSN